jgi:hypothetical protein
VRFDIPPLRILGSLTTFSLSVPLNHARNLVAAVDQQMGGPLVVNIHEIVLGYFYHLYRPSFFFWKLQATVRQALHTSLAGSESVVVTAFSLSYSYKVNAVSDGAELTLVGLLGLLDEELVEVVLGHHLYPLLLERNVPSLWPKVSHSIRRGVSLR